MLEEEIYEKNKGEVITMKKKRSFCLLLSAVVGSLYAVYILDYFYGISNAALLNDTTSISDLSAVAATALVTPHLLLVALAVIFNWVGFFGNKRGFALTAGILYSVSAVVFLMYAMFVVIEIVFSFIGYARLKKINAYNATIAAKTE